jgi:pyruvate,orthophosphate dikinase
MHEGHLMDEQQKKWQSTALQINLERTAAAVEIAQKHRVLLKIVEGYYGVHKRTRELLEEINHPYVNWHFVVEQLKIVSLNDFYKHNTHPDGLAALRVILEIYLDIIRSAPQEDVKERGIRYLFDYLVEILTNSGAFLSRNITLIPFVIESLSGIAHDYAALFQKSSAYLKPVVRFIVNNGSAVQTDGLAHLLYQIFRATYDFWLMQSDPTGWFDPETKSAEALDTYNNIIEPLSHHSLQQLVDRLESIHSSNIDDQEKLASYLDMPDYAQIMNGYLRAADELERSKVYAGSQHLVKLNFLYHIITVPAFSDIHGPALREINRSLGMVFKEERSENLDAFVRNVFATLKRTSFQTHYQDTIFSCMSTIAKEIFRRDNHALVDTFIEEIIAFGFQYPEVQGSTAEWQVRVNPAHIKNIRLWLEIIALKPRWTKRLLSALIINLQLGGIFVRDIDLLQKDISAFLNTDLSPAYNLAKQLLRMFPIYFSEIGAEGELRDISTKIDELSYRQDKLIHFLRKQSHVESNSLLVPFIEHIFLYWYSGDKDYIKEYVPEEVFEQTINTGEYFDGVHTIVTILFRKVENNPRAFLAWNKKSIEKEINSIRQVTKSDKERASLMIRFYQLVYKKYNPQHIDLLHDLESSLMFDVSKIRSLQRHLDKKDYYKSLVIILEFLGILKDRILSPEKTEPFENIYHKRHIAAGIPSMYGTYHEEKFDALGLSLRLENMSAVLFEELINSINLKFITKSTVKTIHDYLWLFVRALELEGIATEGLLVKIEYITSALQVQLFSIDQYLDIFQFISKGVQDIIRNHYVDPHRSNLPLVVSQLLEKKGKEADEEGVYQESENFIRSMIASAFGLQITDNFISNIIRTLSHELERFKDSKQILDLVMTYNPDITISPINKANKKVDNQILLGSKGYFLKELASYNFNIPPGFILTTEVFRCYDAVVGYKYISKDLSSRIYDELLKLEKITRKNFGDIGNPLLLSVRSGAAFSLPGMMNSFLNVGINEQIAEGLSRTKKYRWAAWDCYRRFLQTWGMFQGLERDFFDQIIDNYKQQYGVSKKIQFDPEQMREIAVAYRKAMEAEGIGIIDDPPEQLRQAVLQVFASWHSTRATLFRRQMGLSDEWGTAVIVQAMVFGNLDEHSGSGVFFTRDPKGFSSGVTPYGDFIFGVQGDDIVSGLVETYPISENQRKAEKRTATISLEKRFPEVYAELRRIAELLIYEKGFNHQEIEFTFENEKKEGVFILQTRDTVQMDQPKLNIFQDTRDLRRSLLGIGVGVGGGALSGIAVYSEDEIKYYRGKEPHTPLILIRPDTVPDDVGLLLQVDGLLTAKGGSTSHAAVTIPQLKKVGVVGLTKLKVYEAKKYSTIDGQVIKGGDFIGIDGWSGAVYLGKHEVESEKSYKVSI